MPIKLLQNKILCLGHKSLNLNYIYHYGANLLYSMALPKAMVAQFQLAHGIIFTTILSWVMLSTEIIFNTILYSHFFVKPVVLRKCSSRVLSGRNGFLFCAMKFLYLWSFLSCSLPYNSSCAWNEQSLQSRQDIQLLLLCSTISHHYSFNVFKRHNSPQNYWK